MSHNASRSGRPFGRRGTLTWSFFGVTLVLLGVLATLAYVGYRTSLKITGGSQATAIEDPNAAGYLARVEPTSVQLVGIADDDGVPIDFLLLVNSSSQSTIAWLYGDAVVDPSKGPVTYRETFQTGGLPAVQSALEAAIGLGISDSHRVTQDDLTAIFSPAGTLQITNSDALSRVDGAKTTVAFPSGAISVSPTQAGEYVTFVVANEPPVNRSLRVAEMFRAFYTKLKQATLVEKPSNPASAFFLNLRGREFVFEQIPLAASGIGTSGSFKVDTAAASDLMNRVVDFPQSGFAGQRPRTNVLSALGTSTDAQRAAGAIAKLGAEVTYIGNTPTISPQAVSAVRFSAEPFRAVAERVAASLGVRAELVKTQSEADLVVVLGNSGAERLTATTTSMLPTTTLPTRATTTTTSKVSKSSTSR